MRRLLLIIIAIISLWSCNKQKTSKEINFITSDIDLFWELYDSGDYSQENILDNYLAKGTPGLFDYAIQKSLSTALTFTLNQEKFQRYYDEIRSNTDDLRSQTSRAEDAMVRLREIYPETDYFNVFMIVGALTAGGRISDNGLIIAVELFTKNQNTDLSELSDWQQTVIREKDHLPSIIVHEFIHLQQKALRERTISGTLLEQAILEGMADYIAQYLLPDQPFFNDHLEVFGNAREENIWRQFSSEMDKNFRDTEWLYTGSKTSRGYPADMGYYIGSKILESFVEKVGDTQSAISIMLDATDYHQLFEMSGYADKFK